ncbi:MAG: MerR family transcriptional regulator [Spirochaetaceae bacterium]|nr:MerR family transcriptional regulator [Spirochaetaceae bacterium]
MKYHVGKLSSLFGISAQTLHHYEKLGLLEVDRHEGNAYRSYDDYGFQRLGTIRKLRNAGFSLKDSAFVYGRIGERDVYEKYKKRKREVQAHIREQQRVVDQLEAYLDQLERLLLPDEGFKVLEYDGFHRLDLGRADDATTLLEGRERSAAAWFRQLFFTTTSILLDFDGLEVRDYSMGVIAERSVFLSLLRARDDGAEFIPGGAFASRVVKYHNTMDPGAMGRLCADHLAESGQRLRGKPFTRLVTSFRDHEDNKVNIVELLIPIE